MSMSAHEPKSVYDRQHQGREGPNNSEKFKTIKHSPGHVSERNQVSKSVTHQPES